MLRAVDIMLDVVIFVVNIVPISYTVGVSGPMQYVFSEHQFPSINLWMFETCFASSLAQRLHENGNTDTELANRWVISGSNPTSDRTFAGRWELVGVVGLCALE